MRYVVVHYNEIGLKGKNQPLFLRRLEGNLRRALSGLGLKRIEERSGRMVATLVPEADPATIRERVRCVFGVANFTVAERVELDLEALKTAVAAALPGQQFASFKVATRRGEIELRLDTKGRNKPPEGLIFVPFFDEHRLVNKLTLDATCPISKETDFKKCAAKVVKA